MVEAAPGLYFCGLSFQYAFSSMVLPGVGRDADYVADAIAGQLRPSAVEAVTIAAWTPGASPRSADYRRSRWCRMGVMDDLIRAREAYERREWVAAYEALSGRDPSTLSAEDFARLATAAYLLGRRNDCIQALQRAYQLSRDTGRPGNAARCAFWLAMVLVEIGEHAVSSGWVARAERVLDETSGDIVEHGYVAFNHMHRAVHAAPATTRLERLADEVAGVRRAASPNPDLIALGISAQGMLLILRRPGPGRHARCWTRR